MAGVKVRLQGTSPVTSEELEEVELEPYESRILSLPIAIPDPGDYTLASVHFDFHRFFPYEQSLARKGRRQHATKQQRIQPSYAEDTTLTVSVEPPRPLLSVSLDAPDHILFEGEQVQISLHMQNDGVVPFDQVQLYTDRQGSIHVESGTQNNHYMDNPRKEANLTVKVSVKTTRRYRYPTSYLLFARYHFTLVLSRLAIEFLYRSPTLQHSQTRSIYAG